MSTADPKPEPSDPAEQTSPAGTAGPPAPSDLPTAEELARIAEPATLRRAPRYRAFVVTGIAIGLLLAVVLVLVGALRSDGTTAAGDGMVLAFVGAVLACVGAALGAVVAVLVDRRSR